VLQRPEIDRPPEPDRTVDYNVLWRGRVIGRIWRHEYENHPREGQGPWHWDWRMDRDSPWSEGHAPTLETAMADLRRTWNASRCRMKQAAN